jgi:isoquinoline 1-oxidoreductase beta subunit
MEESFDRLPRRSFIKKVSFLAGGGLLLRFNISPISTMANGSDNPRVTLNGYIRIDVNGMVNIMNPNPEIGQGVKTTIPMIVAEELDVAWENVRVEQAGLDTSVFEGQEAGGSGSVREGWDRFRKAGATARYMLVSAAAALWVVAPERCYTAKGIVYLKETDKKYTYGELVESASKIKVPASVTLKEFKDFGLIGNGKPNVDNHVIVTGQCKYGYDTKIAGMKYAAMLRPPAFGQTLLSFDDSETRKQTGVEDVIRIGDKIAVIGRSTWEVFQGVNKLTAQWKDADIMDTTSDLKKKFIEILHQPVTGVPKRKDGDIEKAFNTPGMKIFEGIYEAPFLAHNTMEPMNFFADVKKDSAILIGPIQLPERARKEISTLLKLPEDKVSIMLTRMGGGFGRRLNTDFVHEAVLISNASGQAVKLCWAREHDMAGGYYRPMCTYRYRAAVDASGKLVAWHNNSIGFIERARNNSFPAGGVPNLQVDLAYYTSKVTTSSWRGPIHNFITFAEQTFIDEIAHDIKKDPVQFRLEILAIAKNAPVGTVDYDPDRFAGVINNVVTMSKWGQKKSNTIFQGVAAQFCFATYVAEVAEVEKLPNGKIRIKKMYCVVDCGFVVNPTGAEAQVQGAITDGICHAMYPEITLTKGKPDQSNFPDYRMIRIGEVPEIEIAFINTGAKPSGLGEPALPPAGPAVANAVFAATGVRIKSEPFFKTGLFA